VVLMDERLTRTNPRRKQPTMAAKLEERYDGHPMVKILDSYVLDAVGALDELTSNFLAEMAPMLAVSLGVPEDAWQRMVEEVASLSPDSRQTLRHAWEEREQADRAAGRTPNALAFAMAVVDATFPPET
jgi:hypothetical protein